MNKLVCINENLCMSKNYIVILIFFFIGLTIFYIYKKSYYMNNLNDSSINKYKYIYLNNNISNILPLQKLLENKDKSILYDPLIVPEKRATFDQQPLNTNTQTNVSLQKLLENRDASILYDPLIAPEKRVSYDQYPLYTNNQINIPTRGYPDNYQLLGLLYKKNDNKILQLFGRATFPGSNQYEYYAITEQYGFMNKIPLEEKKEIFDGDLIKVSMIDDKESFHVKLYNNNTPRYNPLII